MFTPDSVRIVNQIGDLERYAERLREQRSKLSKKDNLLSDSYTMAICSTLDAIARLSNKLAVQQERRDTECSEEA
ncbi:hypothetical protein BME96_12625 [Virgibacillus halodenitrificans]|uniref:Uncharacterized protein n=1 Tax=Virgibacillus halodenitrificans TaxID=1482 RepID=A0AAC9NLR7_VIRHA|nr:hypothetical protein [Virgibacillus halodenitrificans]APC48984.1 hypothetical protein BME96_12625 [Virgibacillus halodenitrificans]